MPTLTEIDQKEEIVKAVEFFIKQPFGFMVFSGKNGTGKSYSAMKIYEALSRYKLPYKDWEESIFITQAELNIEWMKEHQNRGSTYDLLKEFCNTKLLVLDDVGTRIPSEAFMDFLYAVIDHRYTNRTRKGTIITTNLNSDKMREKFGDAFVSRVASDRCYRFDGKDRRIQEF